MRAHRQQNDDRNRHPEQPQQNSTTHRTLPLKCLLEIKRSGPTNGSLTMLADRTVSVNQRSRSRERDRVTRQDM